MRGVHDLGSFPAGPVDRSPVEFAFGEVWGADKRDSMVGVSLALRPGDSGSK